MVSSETAAREPTRVVLLGASNVALGLARAFASAKALTGGPVELIAAAGLGRSYGFETSVLGRRLGGLRRCGLFDALSERPAERAYGLLMDIGNDLLYGASPDETVEWVLECADRMNELGVQLTIASLPLGSLDTLGPWRYRLFRTLLFPRQREPLSVISARARELNEKISKKILERDHAFVSLDPTWYGFDPIHFKRSRAMEAWAVLMRRCLSRHAPARFNVRVADRFSLALARPEKYRVFRVSFSSKQPCREWRDGSSVSLY